MSRESLTGDPTPTPQQLNASLNQLIEVIPHNTQLTFEDLLENVDVAPDYVEIATSHGPLRMEIVIPKDEIAEALNERPGLTEDQIKRLAGDFIAMVTPFFAGAFIDRKREKRRTNSETTGILTARFNRLLDASVLTGSARRFARRSFKKDIIEGVVDISKTHTSWLLTQDPLSGGIFDKKTAPQIEHNGFSKLMDETESLRQSRRGVWEDSFTAIPNFESQQLIGQTEVVRRLRAMNYLMSHWSREYYEYHKKSIREQLL